MTWKAKVSGYLVTKAIAAGVDADRRAARAARPRRASRPRSASFHRWSPASSSPSPASCWSPTSSSRPASTTSSPEATRRRGWSAGRVRPRCVRRWSCALWWSARRRRLGRRAPDPRARRSSCCAAGSRRATRRSCSGSARVAISGRRRCCSRSCSPRRSSPAARRITLLDRVHGRFPRPTRRAGCFLGGVGRDSRLLSRRSCASTGSRHVELADARDDQGRVRRPVLVRWRSSTASSSPPRWSIVRARRPTSTSPWPGAVRRRRRPVRHVRLRGRLRPRRPVGPTLMTVVVLVGWTAWQPTRPNERCRPMTLRNHPPHERWHDWTELDAKAWPDKVERNYTLVPTTCFNCEAACGLAAYFDNETGEIAKFEGNPEHPGEPRPQLRQGPGHAQPGLRPRAHPAPDEAGRRARRRPVGADLLGPGARRDRRPHPHGDRRGPPQRDHVPRRSARRGRLHRTCAQGVGRRRPQQPHQHLLVERPHRLPVVDGPRPPVVATSPTPRSSSSSPPTSRPATTSTPTRSGSWRRQEKGATVICVDPRLSNTGAKADYWLATVARHRAVHAARHRPPADRERHVERDVRAPVDRTGRPTSRETRPDLPGRVVDRSEQALLDEYAEYTPEARRAVRRRSTAGHDPRARRDHRRPPHQVRHPTTGAPPAPATSAAGRWPARLFFLNVLTGSVATKGGTAGNG